MDSLVVRNLRHPATKIQPRTRIPQNLTPPLQLHLPARLPLDRSTRPLVSLPDQFLRPPSQEAYPTDEDDEERVEEVGREEGFGFASGGFGAGGDVGEEGLGFGGCLFAVVDPSAAGHAI